MVKLRKVGNPGVVFRRARIRPQSVHCAAYEEVIDSDIADLYDGNHDDVFESWINMINTMTRREMESDDDMDDEGHNVDSDGDVDDEDDDELMMMCKRKLCFMKKLKEHVRENGVPSFCNVEDRTAEDWMTLKEAGKPEPGTPREPMTVERYTTIFCAKVHNPGRHAGKGNNGGRGGRGRGGRRGKGGRRKKGTISQEVPAETQA